MPARPVLKSLDFRKHGRLLGRLLPEARGFAVCNEHGLAVWTGGAESCADGISLLNARVPGWAAANEGTRRRSLDVDTSIFTLNLVDQDDKPLGASVALVNHNRARARQQELDYVHKALEMVATYIRDDYQQVAELDAMSAELARRYEELNLLYDTGDNVKYFDEGQDALRKLVQNTAEYLDLALCAVVMAEKNITIAHSNPVRPIADVGGLIEAARTRLYDEARLTANHIVCNDPGDQVARRLLPEATCKLLCCPIIDENHDVIGILVLSTQIDRGDFDAGDLNLARIMARKAGRIIQANYDSLTGMMTRHGFEYHLETALYVVRYKRIAQCLLHINTDRLHVVNDTLSHHAGDEVLRRVARAIRSQLRDQDVVARTGGDDFGVLLADCSLAEGQKIAEQIRHAVATTEFRWEQRRLEISVSVGVAAMGPNSEGIVGTLSTAEVACEAAKDGGRNRVQVYAQDDAQLSRRKAQIQWFGQLHNALREDRFRLYAQLIEPLHVATDSVHSEILVRMVTEDGAILSPNAFLPSAERYNLMPALDRWVVRNTLKMLAIYLPAWMRDGHTWSINLSGQSLTDPKFLDFVIAEVRQTSIPPQTLCFEVTETAAVANFGQAITFIKALREQGFRFSLDDFGTGLSSFAYLKSLPVDYLKIDGTFVSEIHRDSVSESMVAAIHQIGRGMGLKTIAEFVENDEIRARLEQVGIDYAQGYGIEKPRPLIEVLGDLVPPQIETAI